MTLFQSKLTTFTGGRLAAIDSVRSTEVLDRCPPSDHHARLILEANSFPWAGVQGTEEETAEKSQVVRRSTFPAVSSVALTPLQVAAHCCLETTEGANIAAIRPVELSWNCGFMGRKNEAGSCAGVNMDVVGKRGKRTVIRKYV